MVNQRNLSARLKKKKKKDLGVHFFLSQALKSVFDQHSCSLASRSEFWLGLGQHYSMSIECRIDRNAGLLWENDQFSFSS